VRHTCRYTAACSNPENLGISGGQSAESICGGNARRRTVAYSVPASPEQVKTPDRLPSSAGLYHLRVRGRVIDFRQWMRIGTAVLTSRVCNACRRRSRIQRFPGRIE
jgi:hypothetical protein